ncbi:nitroreductase family protein [Dongia sp. agr-C8]
MTATSDLVKSSVADIRKSQYAVEPMILHRWSPRAMSGEAITDRELMTLFEAARWAPSSYNGQPWRFVYARRDSKTWAGFCGLLDDFNKGWATKAAVLIVVVSRKTFEWDGNPARTHSFDAGAAWQNLALQGAKMGLVVHGMEGFDYDTARTTLRVPEDFTVEAMVAVGRPGSAAAMDEELQKMETPSDRRPIAEIALEGSF